VREFYAAAGRRCLPLAAAVAVTVAVSHDLDCARAGYLSGGGISRIGRGEVGVPVDELPVAVNAPVDVGDPESHVTPRAAVDADMHPLEADRVSHISAGGDDVLVSAGSRRGQHPNMGPPAWRRHGLAR
jgi:hypothetical protein